MKDNPTINNLITRRSVKSYQPEQIKKEELDAILMAGTYAPTGMNKQSPVMVAVQDPILLHQLSQMNAQLLGTENDPFYGAPTVVVIFGNPEMPTWMEDACLVAGNLMNAAHSLGIGSCWIHRARPMFESEDGRKIMKQWGIPETMIGVANIILGYQKEAPKPRIERKADYIIHS